jgi:hypothetical protein
LPSAKHFAVAVIILRNLSRLSEADSLRPDSGSLAAEYQFELMKSPKVKAQTSMPDFRSRANVATAISPVR